VLNQRVRFYGAIFVSSLGLGAYTYFVPVFAQTFGATFLDLGLIGSASAVAYVPATILAGYLTDKFNRAWLFTGGLVYNALAIVALVFSTSVQDVLVLRLAAGFGLGFYWPVAEVLVADLATYESRLAEMGWYSVAWGSGYLIGPFLGGLVAQRFGFVELFVLSTVFIVFSLVVSLLGVLPGYSQRTSVILRNSSGVLSTIRSLWPWYMTLICYAMVFGVLVAILPGYANLLGVSPRLIGLLFAFFGVTRVIVFAMSGRYSRFGEKKALGVAAGFLAVGSLIIVLFPSFTGFSVALIMCGSASGVIFPASISLISRHFSSHRTGAAMSSFEATLSVGYAVGPLLAGTIATLVDISAAFLMTALFCVLMIVFTYAGRMYVPMKGKI
jgi:MFS family permease